MFQSTRPRGARHYRVFAHRTYTKVSIHAPAWGATELAVATERAGSGFNPRARVGRDIHQLMKNPLVLEFQSTRPRGARLPIELS